MSSGTIVPRMPIKPAEISESALRDHLRQRRESGWHCPTYRGTASGLDRHVIPLHLSRNFGHQAAISAGIDHARGQAIIIMDGDMQDPPEVLPRFLEKWHEGYEVIYAVRQRRKENRVKRLGYHCFYRILHAISDLDIPLDSGDFCLMDRRVADVLKHLPERHAVRSRAPFVRGFPADRTAL